MDIPDTLALKIAHFRHGGRLVARDMDLFGPASWAAVHIGQSNDPVSLDPLLDPSNSASFVDRLASAVDTMARSMPIHDAFLQRIGASAET